jgi:hypothetical protein
LNDQLEGDYCSPDKRKATLQDLDPAVVQRLSTTHPRFLALLAALSDQQQASAGAAPKFDDLYATFDTLLLKKVHSTTTRDKLPIRRLSTPSNVESSDRWSTLWRWYFQVVIYHHHLHSFTHLLKSGTGSTNLLLLAPRFAFALKMLPFFLCFFLVSLLIPQTTDAQIKK